jgi:hypothetical protein
MLTYIEHRSKHNPATKPPLRPHTRFKMGNASSAVLDNIVQGSNCMEGDWALFTTKLLTTMTVDRDEVERLRKRFMKLDKVRYPSKPSVI